jgi:hypothetical protein
VLGGGDTGTAAATIMILGDTSTRGMQVRVDPFLLLLLCIADSCLGLLSVPDFCLVIS